MNEKNRPNSSQVRWMANWLYNEILSGQFNKILREDCDFLPKEIEVLATELSAQMDLLANSLRKS